VKDKRDELELKSHTLRLSYCSHIISVLVAHATKRWQEQANCSVARTTVVENNSERKKKLLKTGYCHKICIGKNIILQSKHFIKPIKRLLPSEKAVSIQLRTQSLKSRLYISGLTSAYVCVVCVYMYIYAHTHT